MNAVTSWNHHADDLRNALAARPAPETALPEYLRALDKVCAETMAAQPDEYLRQEAGILFAQARQAGQMLASVGAEPPVKPLGQPGGALLPLAGAACGFLACAASLLEGQYLAAALSLAAALCPLAPLWRQRNAKAETAAARVRPDRLVALGGVLMRHIDGYLGDLDALNRQIAGQSASGFDRRALTLCQDLWENRGEGPDGENLIFDKTIEYLLEKNGCGMLLYDGALAGAFSTLPSRGENRTLRPAIVEKGTGKVLLRGLAAVRGEGA